MNPASVAFRIVFIGVLFMFWLCPSRSPAQAPDEPVLRQIGRVAHPLLEEISGIAKSRQYENVWWVHNDSGDEPRVFAIDSTGSVHLQSYLRDRYAVGTAADTSDAPPWPGLRLGAAAHIDYEDIAVDDGTLYVGDIGNNFHTRRGLGIHVVPEPHFRARPTRPKKKYIQIAYPDQESYPAEDFHFDAEALFVADGRLHLLTKRWEREGGDGVGVESGTTLYRLDTERPNEVNSLTRVDHHATIPAPTAAAVSPTGDRLAVLSYGVVWVFPRPDDDTHGLSSEPRKIDLSDERLQQAEALTWDAP